MELYKIEFEKTFKGKDGKDRNCTLFALEIAPSKYVFIKPIFNVDYPILDKLCIFKGKKKNA